MPSPLALPPVPPEFHPEFGYIWPAVHNRRLMRIALTAAGVLFGIIAALAMTSRADPDVAQTATALSVAQAQESPIVGSVSAQTMTIPPVAAQSPVVAKSCNEQTWPYLDNKCLKARKRQPVRVLKPETQAQSAPAQVVQVPEAEITAAVKTEAAPKVIKKRERTSKRHRDREFADADRGGRSMDPRNAYATPYPRYEMRRPAWGW